MTIDIWPKIRAEFIISSNFSVFWYWTILAILKSIIMTFLQSQSHRWLRLEVHTRILRNSALVDLDPPESFSANWTRILFDDTHLQLDHQNASRNKAEKYSRSLAWYREKPDYLRRV